MGFILREISHLLITSPVITKECSLQDSKMPNV